MKVINLGIPSTGDISRMTELIAVSYAVMHPTDGIRDTNPKALD
jgi:hypothetical protein